MKKILVTGGTGFQGSSLVRKLLQDRQEVIILNTYSEESKNNVKEFGLEKATIIWGSITDKNLLDKTIRDIDLLFHAAANINVDESIKIPDKYVEVNVNGTQNILNLCRDRNIPMVALSTCEVYGSQQGILNEDSAFMPNSPYAASKAAADSLCLAYYKTYNMRLNILRPSNVFGIAQKKGDGGAVIPKFVDLVLNDVPIKIFGHGNQKREFIYIDDLVNCYNIIVNKTMNDETFKGKVFNLGSGQDITILDLAKLIFDLVPDSNKKIEYLPKRAGEVANFNLNSNKFQNMFSFKPKISIKEGLEKYIAWVKKE